MIISCHRCILTTKCKTKLVGFCIFGTLEEYSEKMNAFWSETFTVRSYEIDKNARLRLPALFNYLQEIAGNHAAHLQLGFPDLSQKGYFWVLSRLQIDVVRLPRWQETIKITTWPKPTERIFAIRDFLVTDEHENVIIRASSGWLIVNAALRQLEPVDDIIKGRPLVEDQSATELDHSKIKAFEQVIYEYSRRVSHNEIDLNNHVNNACYIDWILDCYTLDFLSKNRLEKILVSYQKEAHYQDSVELVLTRSNENPKQHRISVMNAVTHTSLLQAEIYWK